MKEEDKTDRKNVSGQTRSSIHKKKRKGGKVSNRRTKDESREKTNVKKETGNLSGQEEGLQLSGRKKPTIKHKTGRETWHTLQTTRKKEILENRYFRKKK